MGKKKTQEHYQRTESLMYKYKFMKLGLENMEEELRASVTNNGVGSVDPGKEVFKTNKFHSVTETAAIQNIETAKIKRLKKSILLSRRQLDKIDQILEELREEEREVIELFYFRGKQWFEIASKLNYSEKWCGMLRKKALEKISIALGFCIASECKVEVKKNLN